MLWSIDAEYTHSEQLVSVYGKVAPIWPYKNSLPHTCKLVILAAICGFEFMGL